MSSMEALARYCEATRKADALRDELFDYPTRLPDINPIRYCSRSEFDQVVVAAYAKPYRSHDGKTLCADVLGVTFCTFPEEDGQ